MLKGNAMPSGRKDAPPDVVLAFKALGDPTRLKIFEFLCSCCCPVAVGGSGDVRPVDGPTVGEVCCQVTGAERITSTVSFHLKELRLAGLITAEKRGKHIVCGVNHDMVDALAAYFTGQANAGRKLDCC